MLVSKKGEWGLENGRLKKPAELTCYAFIMATGWNPENTKRVYGQFFYELASICQSKGMKFETTSVNHSSQPTFIKTVNKVEQLRPAFTQLNEQSRGKLQMIIVAMDELQSDRIHAEVKLLGDSEFGIPTQCILGKNIMRFGATNPSVKDKKRNRTMVHQLVLKINLKLGGQNFEIGVDQLWRSVTDPKCPTLFLGMDVSHPGTNDRNFLPSLAAVIGNTNIEATDYGVSFTNVVTDMMDAESFCVYILGIELCPDLGIEDKSFEDVTQFTSHQVPLKVSWSDNSETTISKSFDNFYEFHLRLLDLFPREAGQLSDPDSSLECCGLAKNKEMVRKYIDDLLTVPPRLLGCPYAWEFFGRTLPPIPSQSSESTSQDFCLKRLFERNQPFEMVNDEVESEPKEEIETPVMESSSTTDQGPPPTTFLVLPTEVILKIFKLLDVKSKVKFERVCQWFRRHLLQTWSDVTHLVISGAFVGGLLHGDELEFELCRVRCYLMRCDSFSSVMAELDCIEHCNPRTQRSTGFLLLECYSAMFNNVTKVVGILSHSTKLTIFHIIQQCLHSLEEITLSSFSSDAKHHRGVLGMWDTLIGYLQDADSIKKIDIEVPGFALERLLEFMQNKQPRSVVLDVASSHMDNLTQNIIAVADTMSFHGQLRTLSFSFCTGIVSITDVFHGFTDIARETLRSLLISVRQGPKMEIVVDLLPFQELSDLVFNNLDWSKNCRRRVIAFAIELFVQSPHLNSKLVCKLKFRSALTNDRVEDFCNRIIEARNNVPPAAGLVMNLHSDLAINKIILANDYVEISIC